MSEAFQHIMKTKIPLLGSPSGRHAKGFSDNMQERVLRRIITISVAYIIIDSVLVRTLLLTAANPFSKLYFETKTFMILFDFLHSVSCASIWSPKLCGLLILFFLFLLLRETKLIILRLFFS
jgi:hypothetical protein